jgi:penicillin-binding protein 2
MEKYNNCINAIGQGEVLMTPIQLEHDMTVANEGHYYTPHIIKD